MKRVLAVIVVLALALASGCSAVEKVVKPPPAGAMELPAKGDPARDVDERLPRANDAFGWRLLRELPAEGNTLLSPFSVTSALAMTTNGAEGDTREAMERTLGLDAMGMGDANVAYADLLARLQTDTPESKLAIANSLWLREGMQFRDEFIGANRDYYAAESTSVSFKGLEANERIDAWVSQRTRGLIPELFGDTPFDKSTLLVLVNALYFKADWKDAFESESTREETFTAPTGPVSVKMMHRTADLGYLEDKNVSAVRLPYKDGKRAMYVFVPKPLKDFRDGGVDDVLTRLDGPTWEKWMGSFEETEVIVGLPKMKLKTHVELAQPLASLGMGPAFEGGLGAITKQRIAGPVRINRVVHAVTVEVDEKGTEAAAATGVTVWAGAAMSSAVAPPRVYADRPFFFAIRDEASGVVLFAGVVRDPTK